MKNRAGIEAALARWERVSRYPGMFEEKEDAGDDLASLLRAALADVARLTEEQDKQARDWNGLRDRYDATVLELMQARAALVAAVAEEREACRNATCPYCATGFPIVSDSDGDEIGHRLGEDPAVPQVTRPCKARHIRARAEKEAKRPPRIGSAPSFAPPTAPGISCLLQRSTTQT